MVPKLRSLAPSEARDTQLVPTGLKVPHGDDQVGHSLPPFGEFSHPNRHLRWLLEQSHQHFAVGNEHYSPLTGLRMEGMPVIITLNWPKMM